MRNEIALLLLTVSLQCTITMLSSQEMAVTGMAHAYPGGNPFDPFEELNLLSDTPSYYVLEELYNADTLTRAGLKYAYYNYGANRYFFSTSTDYYSKSHELIHYKSLSDSFAIQLRTSLSGSYNKTDSVSVWFKDGKIQRAIKTRSRKKPIEYLYQYKDGLLVEKTISDSPFGQRHYRFTYADGLLKSMESENSNGSSFMFEYTYSDTLNVEIAQQKEDSIIHISITKTKIDPEGRIQSIKSNTGINDTLNLELSFSAEFEYISDDGYKKTFYHKVNEQTGSLEYHSNDILTSTRYLWEGYDQVWVLKRYKF